MVSDPLSAAIDADVERAIRAQLPSIVEALKQSIEAAAPTPARDEFDRFVKPSEAAAILGMDKTTILMQEAKGRLPKRRRVGEATDYLLSDLNEIMGKAVAS
jgi:predicted DNA-binding transcriptional regulator AlpA